MLAVHFRDLDTNKFEGEGYLMPDFETFEDYALNHLKAIKIGENKYQLRVRNSYICLEESVIQ